MGDDQEGGAGLPTSLEVAWGVRDRPTRGPKRGLSLGLVLRAGVTVASTEGLAAVSMSRVAKELGTSAMALYRYVGSKDELLELMVDAALGEALAGVEIAGDDGWRAGLERWAWAELAAYRRHTWALQVPITGPPITPHTIAFLEQGLRCLLGTPVSPGDKMSIILMLTSYTRSWALLSGQVNAAFPSEQVATEAMSDYGATLKKLTTRAEFPALYEVLDAEVFAAGQDEPPDYDFVFGLGRLLDGVAVLIGSADV